MPKRVLLLATLETKREEIGFLQCALEAHGLKVEVVDVSLGSSGAVWDRSESKIEAIDAVGTRIGREVAQMLDGTIGAVAGLGGGTGSEIVLRVMKGLPFSFPKLLISTLPFDPRGAVADNSIFLIPTMVDIAGLNDELRRVFTSSAAMIAGLCKRSANDVGAEQRSVALTALGATAGAAEAVMANLRALGEEVMVFHANGFGGAAFTRFARVGAYKAVIDLTCHELTRLLFAGDHVPMRSRFTSAGDLPRVVLPGGLNFLGLGPLDTLPPQYRSRPHYRHSGYFTHVKLTEAEMTQAAEALSRDLNSASAPVHVVVPMGGFSHRDCPGGEIEDPALRQACLEVLSARAGNYTIDSTPHHINARETAAKVIESLQPLL